MLSNTLTRRVEWGDCDPAGIVFNANFFSWFDHSTSMLYEAAGWPKQEMVERFASVGCALVDTRATFHKPCSFGDDVEITSTIADIRKSSFDIRHILTKGETLCVEGLETRVWTIHDQVSGKLRSSQLPEEVVARFRQE